MLKTQLPTYYSVKSISSFDNSFIVLKSTLKNIDSIVYDDRVKEPRSTSLVGSDAYIRSQRRAFARAKVLAFFNPQLTQFITFTYRTNDHTPTQVYEDMKYLFKQHKRHSSIPIQYIYVLERQKRGSIHVHMIASEGLELVKNKNMHNSVKYWKHGFTSVLTISDFDKNFKPYIYLFKYMAKSQRVGGSFIHVSRNFDKIKTLDYNDFVSKISSEDLIHTENYVYKVNEKVHRITKNYYRTKTKEIN